MMVNSGQLISETYKAQQEHLHATTEYGTAAQHYGPLVSQIVDKLEVTHLLDYGCGSRMSLLKTLKVKGKLTYQGYDPCAGREDLSTAPIPAQMVVCIDVLEHIEPAFLDNVLDHLVELTEIVGLFSIHCGPAGKTLTDGRNAHLTQEPPEWWLPKIMERFDLQSFAKTLSGFHVVVYAKPRIEGVDGKKLA
jgi:hypothetical protein